MDDRKLMAELLTIAKTLAPSRVPRPNATIVNFWAADLKLDRFPRDLWIEAVRRWERLTHEAGSQLEPAALERAAYMTRDLWEANPKRRVELEHQRQNRLNARISAGELPSGVTPLTRPKNPSDKKPAGENTPRRWTGTPLQAKLRAKNPPRTPTNTTETQQQALDNLDKLLTQTLEKTCPEPTAPPAKQADASKDK